MVQYAISEDKQYSKDVLELIKALLEGEVELFDGGAVVNANREEVATKLGKSTRTVARVIKKAEQEGALENKSKVGRNGGLVVVLHEGGGFTFPVVDNPVSSPSILHTVLQELGHEVYAHPNPVEQASKTEEPPKKKSSRRTAREMKEARAMLLIQESKDVKYNRKLAKKSPFIPYSWDFFKTSFGEDAEDIYGAYLLSRMYDAYFEASTNEMRATVERFKPNYGGNYRSLPFTGNWFGTGNYKQFLAIFREFKKENTVSAWSFIANVFYAYNKKAQFKKSTSPQGYAPYPKNLHIGSCLDLVEESVLRINRVSKMNDWNKRYSFDTLPIETFDSMACVATGQALDNYIAEITGLEEPLYNKYLENATTEIQNQFLDNDDTTRFETVLDTTMRRYYHFVMLNAEDVKGLNEDELHVLDQYLRELIFVKKYGLDSNLNLLASPALDKVNNVIRFEVQKVQNDDRLTIDDKYNRIFDILERLAPEPMVSKRDHDDTVLRHVNKLLDFYLEGTKCLTTFLHEYSYSMKQRSGHEQVDMELLDKVLPKVSEYLALDSFGLPDWNYVCKHLVEGYNDMEGEFELYTPYGYDASFELDAM